MGFNAWLQLNQYYFVKDNLVRTLSSNTNPNQFFQVHCTSWRNLVGSRDVTFIDSKSWLAHTCNVLYSHLIRAFIKFLPCDLIHVYCDKEFTVLLFRNGDSFRLFLLKCSGNTKTAASSKQVALRNDAAYYESNYGCCSHLYIYAYFHKFTVRTVCFFLNLLAKLRRRKTH